MTALITLVYTIFTILLLGFIPGFIILCFLYSPERLKREFLFYIPFISISFYAILQFVSSKIAVFYNLQHIFLLLGTIFFVTLILRGKDLYNYFFSIKKREFSFHFSSYWLYLIVPILILLIIQVYVFWDISFPLMADDTVVHYDLTKKIIELGFVSDQTAYPVGLHSFIALCYQWTHFPLEKLLITVTILIVSLMPVSLYQLVSIITKDQKTALITALVSVLFPFFPLRPYLWGGLPFLVGLVFMWQYLAMIISGWNSNSVSKKILSLFLGIGLFLIHSPEFIMAWIFLTIYLLLNLHLLRKLSNIVLIFLQGILLLIVRELLNFRGVAFIVNTFTQPQIGSNFLLQEKLKYFYSSSFEFFLKSINPFFPSLFLLGLFNLKDYYKKKSRGIIFILASLFIIIYIYIDVVFFKFLSRFYGLFFPLFDYQRILEFTIFPASMIVARGSISIFSWLKKCSNQLFKTLVSYLLITFTVSVLIIEALIFKVNVTTVTPPKEIYDVSTWFLSRYIDSQTMVLNDITVFYPSWGGILFRPCDFMNWMESLTGVALSFPYNSKQQLSEQELQEFTERYYVLTHLSELSTDKSYLKQIVQKNKIKYILWSSKVFPERNHTIAISDLMNNSSLELTFVSNKSCLSSSDDSDCLFVFEIKDNNSQ